MVNSLDEVIERLQYKADNIKAKLEPSYFTECIDYLKTLPRVEEEQEIRNKAIDEFKAEAMKQLTDLELKDTWATVSGCKIILRDLAEQMKGE